MNIIFDTNASREYVAKIANGDIEKFAKLNAENFDKKNFKLLLTPIVMMELLYHLVDKNDCDYSISYKSIKAIYLTNKFQKLTKFETYLPPAELIIARDLFGKNISARENMYSSIMHASKLVSQSSYLDVHNLNSVEGGTIRDYIDEIENGFALQVRGFLTNTIEMCSKVKQESIADFINSNHTDFALTLYIVRTTYSLLIKEKKISADYMKILNLNDPNIQKRKRECEFISKKYPAFLSLFKELITRFFESQKKISDEKIKNYIWDILLMFNVNNLTIQKEKVLFVTNDKAMLLSAKKIDDNANIITFEQFKVKCLL